ncbi:MAG: chemotaxis protein CheC [Candidatus Omnitrophica bacterium]|nr:chemotaxis protein CheC [Candidatus Omnitrophota bacterium]
MENINLTPAQLDVLKEIGTVGGGSAATALSQLLYKRVLIDVPSVSLVAPHKISGSEFMIHPEEVAIAVTLNILGKLRGGILVLLAEPSALSMIDILMHREIGSTKLINVMEASALSESVHILCSSYINAVGEFLDLHQLVPSLPQMTVDRMDRLSEHLIKRLIQEESNYFLPIENNMIIEDIKMNLYVIFLLEYESAKHIMTMLNL